MKTVSETEFQVALAWITAHVWLAAWCVRTEAAEWFFGVLTVGCFITALLGDWLVRLEKRGER